MSERRNARLRRTVFVLVSTAVTVMVTAGAVLHSQASGSAPLMAAAGASRTVRLVTPQAVSSPAITSKPNPERSLSGPPRTPCAHNRRAQLVVVSIRRQHAWACAGRQTVLTTAVTTGASDRPGDATPTGSFKVQGLNRNTTLNTSADGSYPVRFWVPFHLGVWGFHDASWQRIPFGSPDYTTRGSHGCVHVPLPAMRWLFHWLKYGTVVQIT